MGAELRNTDALEDLVLFAGLPGLVTRFYIGYALCPVQMEKQ